MLQETSLLSSSFKPIEMITIYHNTRCRKSREGLEILKSSEREYQVREYLKDPLTEKEIEALLSKMEMAPIELVRKDEKLWKEEFRNRDLSDSELIRVMHENPKLIQRPIVETESTAVLGRPPSKISDLLS